MKEYKFYFAVKKQHQLKSILDLFNSYFKGYTLYNTQGYWNKISENSHIIEIINNPIPINLIRYFDKSICELGQQTEVLITEKEVKLI